MIAIAPASSRNGARHAPNREIASPCFSSPDWSTWPIRHRLGWVAEFRRAVASAAPRLQRLMQEEVGKSPWEGLACDVLPLLAACRWHERHAPAILRDRPARGRPLWQIGQRHTVLRRPLGRVAIIATWNYPVQLLGVQLVQALVAGNRVVVKPSEHAPHTQELLLRLAAEAGLPPGALGSRPASRAAGRLMLEQERFDHVVFTGSTEVGQQVARLGAEALTPSTLELSGRDSALVLDDADPALAARCVWHAVTMNAGQTCMAPRRALVHERVYGRFLAALAPLVAGSRPLRLISAAAAAECHRLAVLSVERGGRSLSGVLEAPAGVMLRPLAIVDCPPDAPLVAGEHFGPVLAVTPVSSVAEAVEIHRRCDQHLATSVFTGRGALPEGMLDLLNSRTVTINDAVVPTAHPGVGIGGQERSGWGSSRGPDGLLAMTRAVTVSRTSMRLRIPCAPPAPRSAERLTRALLRWYGGRSREDRSEGDGGAYPGRERGAS